MRGVDRKYPSVGSDDLEGVVNSTPSDRRWGQSPFVEDTVCCVNVIEHQIEGRSSPGLGWPLGVSYDQMRAATQFKYCQLAV